MILTLGPMKASAQTQAFAPIVIGCFSNGIAGSRQSCEPARRWAYWDTVTPAPISIGARAYVIAHRAAILQGQVPRDGNPRGGIDMHVVPHLRPEEPHHRPPPAPELAGAKTEKWCD